MSGQTLKLSRGGPKESGKHPEKQYNLLALVLTVTLHKFAVSSTFAVNGMSFKIERENVDIERSNLTHLTPQYAVRQCHVSIRSKFRAIWSSFSNKFVGGCNLTSF